MNWELLIIFSVSLFVGVILFSWVFNDYRRNRGIKLFTEYITVLDYHMEKAYGMIYKDRVLVYSLEATRPTEEEINEMAHEFVILVQKLLGTNLQKEIIFLYGDTDSFTFNMIEYFNTKFEDDQIRQDAMDNLTSGEE